MIVLTLLLVFTVVVFMRLLLQVVVEVAVSGGGVFMCLLLLLFLQTMKEKQQTCGYARRHQDKANKIYANVRVEHQHRRYGLKPKAFVFFPVCSKFLPVFTGWAERSIESLRFLPVALGNFFMLRLLFDLTSFGAECRPKTRKIFA